MQCYIFVEYYKIVNIFAVSFIEDEHKKRTAKKGYSQPEDHKQEMLMVR
jgi:hypothetical protein